MRAKVKSFYSPEVELDSYAPAAGTNFGFLLKVFVGRAEDVGVESFDLIVCNPAWVGMAIQKDKIFFVKNLLIVEEYNLPKIKQFITDKFESVEAEDWRAVALKLSAFAHWEYEKFLKYA